MTYTRWKLSKVNVKQTLLAIAVVYFFFMFFFHSNIREFTGADGSIYARLEKDDLELTKSKGLQRQQQQDSAHSKDGNTDDTSESRRALIPSATDGESENTDFTKIIQLFRRSSFTYANVLDRCLQNNGSLAKSNTTDVQSTGREFHSSVTNDRLPASDEERRLLEQTGNESSTELMRRYRNAKLPFSKPSSVFSEDDSKFQSVGNSSTLVFSAFLDDRPNDYDNRHNGSHVRLISILEQTHQRQPVYCVFNAEDGSNDLFSSRVTNYYEMCENHRKRYGGFILSCQVPMEIPSPCFVTLYSEDPESDRFDITRTRGTRVPIRVVDQQHQSGTAPKGNIVACVSPLFGKVKALRLVEFIEFSLSSGIDRIVFYPMEVTPEILKVLEFYTLERKVVDIVPWKLFPPYSRSIWYQGQLLAIQDCLYRSMASFSYVTFVDIDELFVPRAHDTILSLVESLATEKTCGFQFATSYFEPLLSQQKQQQQETFNSLSSSMVIPNSYHRSKSADKKRTKCIVRPRYIFESGIHHISKPIWSFMETQAVDPNDAIVHHYKSCSLVKHFDGCTDRVIDKSASKFSKTAVDKMAATLSKLKLIS